MTPKITWPRYSSLLHTLWARSRDLRKKGMSFGEVTNRMSDATLKTEGVAKVFELKNQLAVETKHASAGSPYYKLYPSMVQALMATKLDIPTGMLRTPFAAFEVCVPHQYNPPSLRLPPHQGNPEINIKSFLFILSTERPSPEQDQALADVVRKEGADEMFIQRMMKKRRSQHATLALWVDLSASLGETYHHNFCVSIEDSSDSLEDCLDRGKVLPSVRNCIRLACGVSFLATGAHKWLEPDVLSKDFSRFIEKTRRKEPTEELVQKALKKGKKGWTLGRKVDLPFPYPTTKQGGDTEPTDRHLHYSHVRAGHYHVVRYGPKHNQARVDWFPPTWVRSDLPLDPRDRAYSG